MSRNSHPRPSPAELRNAAHAACVNDAARVLFLTGSPLNRKLAHALLKIRDHLHPLADAEAADAPKSEAHRLARVPPVECVPTACGLLLGELLLPAAPPASAWLRPLARYHAEALRIARESASAADALAELNALRVSFAFDAGYYCWRAMSISAGACAAVDVLLLRLSAALGSAAIKAPTTGSNDRDR